MGFGYLVSGCQRCSKCNITQNRVFQWFREVGVCGGFCHCGRVCQGGNGQNLLIQMVLSKHSKEKEIAIHETTTYEQQIATLKEGTFSVLAAHIQQNCEAPAYPFYFCLLLEHLALLWYLLHPGLNVYQGAYLQAKAAAFLRLLNPHEFMTANPDYYHSLILIVGLYLLLQLLLVAVSAYATLRGKSGEFFKYLRKIVNYQFLLTAKAFSGPILALVVNVVYCDPNSPYHRGQSCYDPPYVVICAVATLVGVVVVVQVLLLALIYYIRNPLDPCYMGVQNRYYVLSKSILKILMPLYFAVDPSLSLSIVYMFTVTGLWAFYLFWHRLFSVHSYNQRHFYVEYFLEAALFWIAASNLIYYYASSGPVLEEFSFVYTVFSAVVVAVLLMSIEARAQENFFKECLSGKVKKQNMEKFTFVLIHRLLYCSPADARLRFKAYCKLIAKNGGMPISGAGAAVKQEGRGEKEDHVEVYRFLSRLLEGFLLENNSTMLKAVRCHLSCLLGLRSHGIHQSLELQQQRLSLVEELMLFQFRQGVNLFQNEGCDKENREFLKFYRFHEQFGRLEVYVEACARNNAEYWQELCEADPSLAKLRNLATLYSLYEARITDQYAKIAELVPESLQAATLYHSFLLSAGVDVRGQARMKEKLSSICEARSKSTKISNQEIREDEEMSIITLDTIGNNLGVVLNSNSHVRELLGFQKAALVGKNITKIMPKIYTQLHNAFMLGFIRSEYSHQTSVKRVTALNRHSLLVDINLSVRILSSSQSDLAIVGFMKRLPGELFVGLVMYSVTNGEVLGIDENFVEMMNRRLSGKQVAQEEVRLTVLVPELNMQQLQREREQETVLEVGSSLEEEGELEVQKRVLIRQKGIKIYEGVKLGFLEVVDLARYQSHNSKLVSSFSSRIPRIGTKEIVAENSVRPSHKKRTQDLSIHLSQSQRALNESGEGVGREVAVGRRMEQFVKGREGSGVGWALKVLYCVCVLGCLATALYTYFSHAAYLNQKGALYLTFNQTLNIANDEAAINTYVAKIWNINSNNYASANYPNYFSLLNSYILNLKNTYSQLTTTLSGYEYPLEYNQHNYYNITFTDGVNGALAQVVRPSTYANAISNYITAANIFTQAFISNASSQQRLILQMEAFYVQQNGEALLPAIAISAMNKYYSYFTGSLQQELTRMVIVKALLMVVIVVCFVCILLLAHYLQRVNLQVVQIYTSVRLADVSEVLNRCNRFLGLRGLKAFSRQRTSSLLKMPTTQNAVPQVPPITVSEPRRPREDTQLLTTEEPLIQQTQNNEERLMTFEDQQAQAEGVGVGEGEQALLRGKQQEPTIKIEQERSNARIIIALAIFFCVFGTVIIFSYLEVSSDADTLQEYIYRLKVIGEVKKTLNLIDYYAYRVTLANNDAHTKSLLVAEIASFFQLTQDGYVYLGDPQPILKGTYSLIETIQQWLTVTNVTSKGILFANYPDLDEGLQDTIQAISMLDSSTFYPQFLQEIRSANQCELIFTLILIGFMCLAVLALHNLHLGPVRTQGRHSLNMLRILPPSLLQRNPKAMKIITSS